MLDKKSSLRLTIIRFPLIVGVVFIHASSSFVSVANGTIGLSHVNVISEFVKNIISHGIARIAVPLFFVISGYLFFISIEWTGAVYFLKIKKRIKTLLIPFLFWNILLVLVMIIAQSYSATQTFFAGKKILETYSFWDYCNAVLGINRSPISHQFWFIRDLMIVVIFTPVIYFMVRKLPILFFMVIFVFWFFNFHLFYLPSTEAILFFSLGSYIAIKGKSLFDTDKYGLKFILIYFPLVLIDALTHGQSYNVYIHHMGILMGLLSILYITGIIIKSQKAQKYLIFLGNASFFVFATHEPLLTIVKKAAYRSMNPETTSIIMALYFILPITVIILSTFSYVLFLKLAPNFTGIITGGRQR